MISFSKKERRALVFTIPDKCRVCYTCVRECPAKAIRIEGGQAAVVEERCIACGNCVKVCSQGAKAYWWEKDLVAGWLGKEETIALVAPSFPAEFMELSDYRLFVGMLRQLGFNRVCEVGFGADLMAKRFKTMLANPGQEALISSDCPAIVQYVEHYHPDLIHHLSPLVSPMVAMCRVVRKKYGSGPRLVFIGPCIGKKAESDEIDAGITFQELRSLLKDHGIIPESVERSNFDPPYAGKGGIFPVKRGLLQTLNIPDDLFEGNIVVADGRVNFQEAISEFESGSLAKQNLELLCCEGCIMGPGMSVDGKRFSRRSTIGAYMRQKMDLLDVDLWNREMEAFSSLDLSRSFSPSDRRLSMPKESRIDQVLKSMGKTESKDHLNCGACGYESCRNHAIAIAQGLAETEMCLPDMIEKLAHAQRALKQSEKLAHMGQLSAGIAHELNNPLGVVLMYANIVLDEHPEGPFREDLQLIADQADRCKRIVGNLLNFARKNQLRKEEVNLVELARESIRSLIAPSSIEISLVSDFPEIFAPVDREQLLQVLTNLNRNAVEAMPSGGYLNIELHRRGGEAQILVQDTGSGIPEENMDKLFTPFFTTKEFGKGTGLGLATSYGILKMHRGRIEVESNCIPEQGPTGTTFSLFLPIKD